MLLKSEKELEMLAQGLIGISLRDWERLRSVIDSCFEHEKFAFNLALTLAPSEKTLKGAIERLYWPTPTGLYKKDTD